MTVWITASQYWPVLSWSHTGTIQSVMCLLLPPRHSTDRWLLLINGIQHVSLLDGFSDCNVLLKTWLLELLKLGMGWYWYCTLAKKVERIRRIPSHGVAAFNKNDSISNISVLARANIGVSAKNWYRPIPRELKHKSESEEYPSGRSHYILRLMIPQMCWNHVRQEKKIDYSAFIFIFSSDMP